MQTLAEPRSLLEPDTAEDAVMAAMMSLGRRLRQRRPEDPVDFSALPILKLLDHTGPLRLSVVAARLDLDASTVSRHVRHLEDRGLLERTGDPDDGRASRVTLSDDGRDCLRAAFDARRAMIRDVLSSWNQRDRDRLRGLLARFYNDLDSTLNDQENP